MLDVSLTGNTSLVGIISKTILLQFVCDVLRCLFRFKIGNISIDFDRDNIAVRSKVRVKFLSSAIICESSYRVIASFFELRCVAFRFVQIIVRGRSILARKNGFRLITIALCGRGRAGEENNEKCPSLHDHYNLVEHSRTYIYFR